MICPVAVVSLYQDATFAAPNTCAWPSSVLEKFGWGLFLQQGRWRLEESPWLREEPWCGVPQQRWSYPEAHSPYFFHYLALGYFLAATCFQPNARHGDQSPPLVDWCKDRPAGPGGVYLHVRRGSHVVALSFGKAPRHVTNDSCQGDHSQCLISFCTN